MKNCGSTSSSSKVMDEPADIINSLSLSDVQKNATEGCQHFSIRRYVAETREIDPKACNPFGENNYHIWEQLKAPLEVPQFKWWRCTNCVRDLIASSTPPLPELQETSRRLDAQLSTQQLCASVEHKASGDATGEGSKALIEVLIIDDEGNIQEISPLEELARVATLLEEMESAEGQGSVKPGEKVEKRPSPFSLNTDLTSKKHSKATGDSSRPHQDRQKRTFKKQAAQYTREPYMDCITSKNPADFDAPGPQENYMIRGEDLKLKNSGKRRRGTN